MLEEMEEVALGEGDREMEEMGMKKVFDEE
jgi:hypothetical protein